MPKETALRELQELTGTYRGTTTNKMFTTIEVGTHCITLETAAPPTSAIVEQLKQIGEGTKIGIIRIGGTLRVRRSEGNK